eukprot:7368374-Alexandrium_andersonii.AAC.1
MGFHATSLGHSKLPVRTACLQLGAAMVDGLEGFDHHGRCSRWGFHAAEALRLTARTARCGLAALIG